MSRLHFLQKYLTCMVMMVMVMMMMLMVMTMKYLTCLGGPTFLASIGSRGRRVFSFSFSLIVTGIAGKLHRLRVFKAMDPGLL